MYKAIIFDFYGVICNEIGSQWYKTRIPSVSSEEVKRKYDDPSDLGEITDTEFFEAIGAVVQASGAYVRDEWMNAATIDQSLVELIRDLGQRYQVAICSNAGTEIFWEILKKNDLEGLFDVIVCSSQIHMIKPNPEIFAYTLKELKVLPQEALFIDDREVNVQGARAAGLQALLYKDVETLRQELTNLL